MQEDDPIEVNYKRIERAPATLIDVRLTVFRASNLYRITAEARGTET